MNDICIAIIAATGTARKRVIPAVRERDLCAIAAIHGRDPDKLAALAAQNGIPRYFVDAERMLDETSLTLCLSGLHRLCIKSTYGYVPRGIFPSCARSPCACRLQRRQLSSRSWLRVQSLSELRTTSGISLESLHSARSLPATHLATFSVLPCSGAFG